ncbi:hypothetical protein M378DRAFT_162655 [Amanita muscaria Koide BX008]|uniref:Uncharacterized protein n=1 Tax=Amanita muscaria (strain Koide BX008) TaxID=946122 RepID=A0A0C2WSW7_AMAMK|nr:hypothetical protein M378DRAFT_162655 [Amanita muscaria Koide BX008]
MGKHTKALVGEDVLSKTTAPISSNMSTIATVLLAVDVHAGRLSVEDPRCQPKPTTPLEGMVVV